MPHPSDRPPHWTSHWHGDTRRAALFTLRHLLRRHDRTTGIIPAVLDLAATTPPAGLDRPRA